MKTKYNFDLQVYKTVADNINKYLALINISNEELATIADIKLDYLSKFLNYNPNLTISIYDLYKISVILDTNINNFFN